MQYLEIRFSPVPSDDEKSILIAELLQVGFESFNEEENAVLAYCDSAVFHDEMLKEIDFLQHHPEIECAVSPLDDINWNKEWESNYQPVIIAGKCHVRAPFHPSLPEMLYDILIEPGMAFGTAHHETTRLMAGSLMELDVKGKDVLDMGCGTGILAILANKMGAAAVIGIDNDEWAWRNATINFNTNGVNGDKVFLGEAALIGENRFDVILANINRNVLLQDMKAYFQGIRDNGLLVMSGFYVNDKAIILKEAEMLGLHYLSSRDENDWAVILLKK
jgi:ribosomal protein L11 methyltransferase